jgi:hypothetical protein
MIRSVKTKTAGLAAVGVLAIGGAGAYAATSGSGTPTPLTGSITDQASAAVTARYPGATLIGIDSTPNGDFLTRVRKSDGSEVVLTLDRDFAIIATRAGGWGHGGPGWAGGPGGPGHFGFRAGGAFDTAALARALGVSEDKLRAALDQVRPARPSLRSFRHDARPGAQPDFRALRETIRAARERFATQLARALGLDVDKVEQALDDARPSGPPAPPPAAPAPPARDGGSTTP